MLPEAPDADGGLLLPGQQEVARLGPESPAAGAFALREAVPELEPGRWAAEQQAQLALPGVQEPELRAEQPGPRAPVLRGAVEGQVEQPALVLPVEFWA